MNTKLAIKVAVAWTSIAYVACYAVVALFPRVRSMFFEYAFHSEFEQAASMMGLNNFVSGLVFWIVLATLGAWLLAWLVNRFNK